MLLMRNPLLTAVLVDDLLGYPYDAVGHKIILGDPVGYPHGDVGCCHSSDSIAGCVPHYSICKL